jgi:hypothetical protein
MKEKPKIPHINARAETVHKAGADRADSFPAPPRRETGRSPAVLDGASSWPRVRNGISQEFEKLAQPWLRSAKAAERDGLVVPQQSKMRDEFRA